MKNLIINFSEMFLRLLGGKFGDKSTRNSGLSVDGLQFPVALN